VLSVEDKLEILKLIDSRTSYSTTTTVIHVSECFHLSGHLSFSLVSSCLNYRGSTVLWSLHVVNFMCRSGTQSNFTTFRYLGKKGC